MNEVLKQIIDMIGDVFKREHEMIGIVDILIGRVDELEKEMLIIKNDRHEDDGK